MSVDTNNVVHLVNGRLSDGNPKSTTSRADITRMVQAALAKPDPELVLHFHGGLVNEKAGRGVAAKLAPMYSSPSRYPLFFVWESGFIEAIANNLDDIGDDPLFQALVKKCTKWVLSQLPGASGLKGAGGAVNEKELNTQYDAYFRGRRQQLPDALQPVDGKPILLRSATVPPVENALQLQIQLELGNDELKELLESLHASISPAKVKNPTSKESGVGARVNPLTEIAPQQVNELFDITPQSRGVFSIAKAALFIAKVVIAVIKRFAQGRAHGVYTTIIEEILAAAYIDKVGGIIWGQMKKDTADAFDDAATCGGAALLDEIVKQAGAGKQFSRIVLIGHSTGAIYICNFIDEAAKVLPTAKFDVIFLAPAVTHTRFAQTLSSQAAKFSHFRQLGMHDSVESEDRLVSIVYPRSLLYFVSGVVEFMTDVVGNPQRAADTPLVGMERYRLDAATFTATAFPDIKIVEDFYAIHPSPLVWSLTPAGTPSGVASESRKHGDFDDDPSTLASLSWILEKGF